MNKVLFICGLYSPNPSANGVCVIRLQEVFLKHGTKSDVICIGSKPNTVGSGKYGDCYYIKGPQKNSKNKIRALLQKSIHFFSWPLIKESLKEYKLAIKHMVENNDYDLIIAVCQPVAAAYACAKYCKKEFVMYELDSITNIPDTLHGVKKVLKSRVERIEKFIYDKATYIFHTKCDEKYYEKPKYDKYRVKWEFTDIPHLVHHEQSFDKCILPNNEKIIAYTGLLTKERNDPEYFLQLIVSLSKRMNVKAYFTTHGDCEELLHKYHDLYPNVIIPLGFVSFEELQRIRKKTYAFISLGLRYGGEVTSVQSKVFEYMSTGKQIIHINGSKNDVEKDYLKKYGNALLLDRSDDFDANVNKIFSFLSEMKTLDVDFIRKTFPMNTPEWTVERMIAFKEKNDGKE